MRVCGVEFKCSCSKIYTTYEALLTHAKRSLHIITEKYKNSLKYVCYIIKMISVVLIDEKFTDISIFTDIRRYNLSYREEL